MIAILATRFGQTAALLIIAGIAWTTWIIQHDNKVIAKQEVRVEKEAEQKDARAQTARKRVDRSTDVGVLLAPYYRD